MESYAEWTPMIHAVLRWVFIKYNKRHSLLKTRDRPGTLTMLDLLISTNILVDVIIPVLCFRKLVSLSIRITCHGPGAQW